MLPLLEKTVVVTRPREQAAELKFELEKLGAKVVLFPTIEIIPPESYAALDAALLNLSDYDWLVMTSANAAEHFLRRLEANGLEITELDYLRVCAIGAATFERLRLAQVHVDVLPDESRAEGVFAALGEYLGNSEELKDLRFLLPRSSIARDFLPRKLSEAGALVTEVTAYRTILPQHAETGKLTALFKGGAIDCVTFTSPSTFTNFVQMLNQDNLSLLLLDVAIACLGETTARSVRRKKLPVDIVADQADSSAFAAKIAVYYQDKRR